MIPVKPDATGAAINSFTFRNCFAHANSLKAPFTGSNKQHVLKTQRRPGAFPWDFLSHHVTNSPTCANKNICGLHAYTNPPTFWDFALKHKT
jgi:hypothetical protein